MTTRALQDLPVLPCPQWIISDTHFGHDNILQYCPWRSTWAASVQEHDEKIIAAWQACVKPHDWVLHIGDFALGDKARFAVLRQQLPGHSLLVRGNHDRSAQFMRLAGFDVVVTGASFEQNGKRWIARHNPGSFSLDEAQTAERLLHGHCHGNPLSHDIHERVRAQTLDCSLDAVRSLAPISWDAMTGIK